MTTTQTETLFQKHNWRLTSQVRAVLKTIEDYESFLTPHEIQAILKEEKRDISRSSIYRILQKLKELDLVEEFFGEWILTPQGSYSENQSHFYVCEGCGRAKVINLNYYDFMKNHLKTKKGFHLNKAHIRFHGTCSECSERN